MSDGMDGPTPYMQRVKSQTDVLVPLLKHLRAELGAAKANALVYPVLRNYMKNWIADFASTDSANPIENFHNTSARLEATFEGDVEETVLRDNDEGLHFNVTSCRYADFFRQLGEPELGTILVCEADNHVAELSAPAVELTRRGTLMKGGSHCPFRYRFSNQESK